ncbi:hypothetical protein QLQ12_28005 [Actinoplanes sp. NEAU-A12]|uniref:Uncharacterized protein n=1 Tax=Actinoplanes sandaracinus TaxID=3045177 RepID=A0ABT6WS64_9ACTN|nr:hypothetical protein [Actinoplanes sandaracinus]MDI6102470.1 hypothetical protein [Actinoplanes sandaracinus]
MIRPIAFAAAGLLAGGIVAPAAAGEIRFYPAAAAEIRFDPATKTGFVDAEDVRKAFGWDAATLARNAPDVGFTYHLGKEEIYTVFCDRDVRAEVSRNPGSTSDSLIVVVTAGPGAGSLEGFRLTGAGAGASSIEALPEAGHPCPDERGKVVRRVTYVHTKITEALSAEFRDTQAYLTRNQTVSTSPPAGD